jgi:hypothetical protein
MASGGDVLFMLCPNAPAVIYGDDYDNINWFDNEPAITKKQFEDGFAKYDAWKAQQDAAKATAKTTAESKLAALGLTTNDLRALGL